MRAPLLLLLLLSGCAERWTRPGATEAEAEQMNAACANDAQLAVPPQMAWQMVAPPRVERERQCWRDGPRERCRILEHFRPARFDWVDLATGARDRFRTNCMREKGFAFQGYRLLRIE